jgi:hypothetical protein
LGLLRLPARFSATLIPALVLVGALALVAALALLLFISFMVTNNTARGCTYQTMVVGVVARRSTDDGSLETTFALCWADASCHRNACAC